MKTSFEEQAKEIFQLQSGKNPVYRNYLQEMKINPGSVQDIFSIPFLPVEFFKTHRVITGRETGEASFVFASSGTTGAVQSKHFLSDISLYEKAFLKNFEYFYGSIKDYCIVALLPSYLERKDSSLVHMVDGLMKKTKNPYCGFYLKNTNELIEKIYFLEQRKQRTILIGVTYALLDLAEKYAFKLNSTIVMETGGMKGTRKEMVREELHEVLCRGFGISQVHSEYGMTELLSQAYSKNDGMFLCPPSMKVLIRDINDPFKILGPGRTGGINVIDLANLNSCSFIATQDLGKINEDGSFEVLGRFDHSDLRGCNLLLEN